MRRDLQNVLWLINNVSKLGRRDVRIPVNHCATVWGAVCRGVQEKHFKSGEQWKVLRREEGAVIVGKDGVEKQLPLDQARKFSVFERQKITLSIGDRVFDENSG